MQRTARQRKETGLDMRDLHSCANPCNALIITRDEQESGSSPLVDSLSYLQNPLKATAHDVRVGGIVNSRLSQCLVPRIGVLQVVAGHSRWRRRILWHCPSGRCARVSAGVAPSKEPRPSAEKLNTANFALTGFSEVDYSVRHND